MTDPTTPTTEAGFTLPLTPAQAWAGGYAAGRADERRRLAGLGEAVRDLVGDWDKVAKRRAVADALSDMEPAP